MNIEQSKQSGVNIISLIGDMDDQQSQELNEAIHDLLTERVRVVLDMQQVAYINSSGLGQLVQIAAQINQHEGRLLLAGLTPFISGVLETTKLNQFFETASTCAEAVEKLTPSN